MGCGAQVEGARAHEVARQGAAQYADNAKIFYGNLITAVPLGGVDSLPDELWSEILQRVPQEDR